MKRISLISLIILSMTLGCQKETVHAKFEGTLTFKAVDGCSWMIDLGGNTLLEPTNLDDFQVTIREGQSVRVTYKRNTTHASICMMGTMVDLIYIEDK